MQTILGAGGAIGNELAKALTAYTPDIRIVSRSPKKVNEGDILFKADLKNQEEVNNALKNSEVAYLTAGLPYDLKVWQKSWPMIMQNVINACVANNCRLVFFDNIYLYSAQNLNPIKETNTVDPPSKKGKVRNEIVQMIWRAVEQKKLQALIARCADYYGPSIQNTSLLTETVIKPLSTGATANWLISDKHKHSFTYIADAGKATALLGNTANAFGETWHLPTAKDPLTGKEWVELFAREMGVKPKYRVVNKTMVRLIGLFVPAMRESVEMLYQYDKDYVFDSDKFEQRFSSKPTPYLEGIKQIIQTDYRK
ncbi:MAG TPA: NAD-dependent epimerase/dehydratase family protein [Chryseolinea sp.]|nr:NAD-dependent epimerase/dehydratase family protein [Chryseolinea sp.]